MDIITKRRKELEEGVGVAIVGVAYIIVAYYYYVQTYQVSMHNVKKFIGGSYFI